MNGPPRGGPRGTITAPRNPRLMPRTIPPRPRMIGGTPRRMGMPLPLTGGGINSFGSYCNHCDIGVNKCIVRKKQAYVQPET